jgi:hypothetical protein
MTSTYLIGNDEKRRGWFVTFYNQWPAILHPSTHNWQDWSFCIFKLAGENSPYKRSWEIEIALLGFHIDATYVYRDTTPDFP